MIKVIIVAILAFFYYWFSQRLKMEKRKGKRIGIKEFIQKKDDEILRSIIAMIIILLILPYLAQGIVVWLNISEGIPLELIKLLIGFLAGMIGTYIIDKFTSFSKRKLKDKLNF